MAENVVRGWLEGWLPEGQKLPHITRVELKGFKSFGNAKVSIPLSKGLTAIVGPNGHGKSNIMDALYFVMGGLSATTMRVERFSDFLFKGDEKLGTKPAPFGEVVLHFNNEDGAISIHSPVVSISRWISRSGKCNYKINGKAVSRQDVVDLLAPVVSSPGEHNFVIQGTVGSIAEKNPIERREIVDELAGVGEYEKKKRDAFGQLQGVDGNISKLDAGMKEISTQLEGLRGQMQAAMEHNQVAAELDQVRAALLKKKFIHFSRKASKLRAEWTKMGRSITVLEKKRKRLGQKAKACERELQELDGSIRKIEEEGLLQRAEAIRTQLSTFTTLQKSAAGRLAGLVRGMEKTSRSLAEAKIEASSQFSFSSEFSRLHEKFLALHDLLVSANTQEEAVAAIQQIRRLLEDLGMVIKGLSECGADASRGDDKGLGEIHNKLMRLTGAKESCEAELKGLENKIEDANAQLKEIEPEEKKLRVSIRALRERRDHLSASVRDLRQRADDIRDKIQDLTAKRGERNTSIATTGLQLEGVKTELEKAVADPAPFLRMSLEELEGKSKQLEAKLGALGPVNQTAARSFRETEERFNEKKRQHDKLLAEKQSLLDFMAEVEKKKKEVFMKTFGEISWQFNQIFSELSGGGTGELKLENPESPFDGGLAMEVSFKGSPPGLCSLSGGQKTLTALAFILALQKYRPTTFYIMDEIDDNLDPNNRERVAKILQKFSRESQIVVITHHNTIPSLASRVFGVVKDNGVSRLYSVDLSGFGG
ncbi:MAG: AAA family ATPase [Candidatus Hadarchaeota archaeon]